MQSYFVSTARGLEPLVEAELLELGIEQVKIARSGVSFKGSLEQGYKVCLWSRCASRVLLSLSEFDVRDAMDLYLGCSMISWESIFDVDSSFAIDFSGTNDEIRNTQFGAMKVKDAIVDRFRKKTNARPDVEKQGADIRITVRLQKGKAMVYLDMAGSPLHHRGYRDSAGTAPLKESLAAAMVKRSGWTDQALFDPMCGSGTIVIEAALMAAKRAPGLLRHSFGFDSWKGHDPELWASVVAEANEKRLKEIPTRFFASDISRTLVNIARENARRAGVDDLITFSVKDVGEVNNPLPEQQGVIVSNPPYGERMGGLTGMIELYGAFGVRFKEKFPGWRLTLLSTDTELLSCIGLRAHKTYKVFNGALECVLKNYQIGDSGVASGKPPIYAEAFGNRLKKNLQQRKKWAKREALECYRVYDADLPEYNVAIDKYGDYVVLQEYAAPKEIAPEKAKRRLLDVIATTTHVMALKKDQLVVKTRERQKGANQYQKAESQKFGRENETLDVMEYGAKLRVNLWDYLDTGLFLDHRPTRKRLGELAAGKDFLNLFCYTATASVHAALGGAASTTSVDMSNTYINWAKDNFSINRIKGKHEFVQADCLHWLEQCEQSFDLIFVDPPTFSNSKRMESTFEVQRDHLALLTNASRILRDKGTLVFSNNMRGFKLDRAKVEALGFDIEDFSQKSIPEDFKRNSKIHQCWILTKK